MELTTIRRDLQLASRAAAMPLSRAATSPTDLAQTIIKPAGEWSGG
jgi:hypothetical protein